MSNAVSSKRFTPFLSKSRFIKGMQCHKALWFQTHRPELKQEASASLQAIFDSGHEVGTLAQQLFPGGVEVPFDGVTLSDQVEQTRSLIASGIDTIYEAAFSHDNIFVKADILHRTVNGWKIGEVKSSTKAKEVYVNDAAVQYHVISGCGIPVSDIGLVLIDTGYVRHGDIDPQGLFKWVDVTEKVLSRQGAIVAEAKAQRTMLCGTEPAIDIGPHCSEPYECDFAKHCWQHIPSPSVFDFSDIGKPDAFELYRQGIIKMEDVPPTLLKWRQQLQLDGFLHNNEVVDAGAVQKFMNELWYPLVFLDFETTYMTPIPLFDGTSPYQQVPFQYSLHMQYGPDSELQHHEFLAPTHSDPREEFLNDLLAAIPEDSCILIWNVAFESKILRALAQEFPQHQERIDVIIDNMVDLMSPFRSKNIYHWQFDGSYSLKYVLPALVPELSYDSLTINNGSMASDAWLTMRESEDADEIERLRRGLLEYCHLDTLAMVKILEKMKAMVNVK
jgi:hypothetical protein